MLAVGAIEAPPEAREPIEMRCRLRMPVAAEAVAQIVREHEQHVGPSGSLGGLRRLAGAAHERETAEAQERRFQQAPALVGQHPAGGNRRLGAPDAA